MTETAQPIFPLPPSVRSLLRSTIQLPSIASVVTQLVYNALDAGASNIEVSLDLSASTIICRDDGHGFPAELLAPTGATGQDVALQRYVVSRRQGGVHVPYGVRGEALASMAAIGLLIIETTLDGSSASPWRGTRWTTMQRGDRLLYSGPSSQLNETSGRSSLRSSAALPAKTVRGGLRGSEITVRDIFHELPLRRPSRLDPSAQRAEIEKCRRALVDVALREPSVAFILRASSHSASDMQRARADDKIILRCEKAPSLVSRFGQLLLPVLPAQAEELAFDLPLQNAGPGASTSTYMVHVRGFFSSIPQASKAHQVVYLQGHRLRPEVSISEHWASILGNQRIDRRDHGPLSNTIPADTLPLQSNTPEPTGPQLRWHSKNNPQVERTLADQIAAALARAVTLPSPSVFGGERPGSAEQRGLRSPYPAFLMDIWIKKRPGADDVLPELALDENVLAKAICDEIKRLLRRRGLIPDERRKNAEGASKRTLSAPCDRPSTTTSSGAARPIKKMRTARSSTVATAPSIGLRALPTVFPTKLKASVAARRAQSMGEKDETSGAGARPATPEGFRRHTDPDSLKSYFIDLRTGNSYSVSEGPPSEAREARSDSPIQRLQKPRQLLKRSMTQDHALSAASPSTPQWLRETLAEWKSPALAMQPAEPDIPSLALPLNNDGEAVGGGSIPSRIQKGLQTRRALAVSFPNVQLRSQFFASSDSRGRAGTSSPAHACGDSDCCSEARTPGHCKHTQDKQPGAQRISKAGLKNARVIAQVATKFIVCVVPGDHDGHEEVLVCIDQHAADERVRFEAILEEYSASCESGAPLSHELKEPVPVWLPSIQAQGVLDVEGPVAQALAYWGFGVAVEEKLLESDEPTATLASDETKIKVTHVPSPVADRLRMEVATLRSVILDFLDFYGSRCAVTLKPSMPAAAPSAGPTPAPLPRAMQSARLHQVPPALLSLFKSKACRGAIMFNDELTLEQCHRLVVEQLAHTAFPFQCAHGRPSMAPLCSLGVGSAAPPQGAYRRAVRKVDWDGVGKLG